MRAASEHPRVLVAKALGMLCLIGCSLAAGFLLGGGDDDEAVRTQQRVAVAERALRRAADELRLTRAQLARQQAAQGRVRARLRTAARSNKKLRRQLRAARRSLRRARR